MIGKLLKMLGVKTATPVVEEAGPGQVSVRGPGVELSASLPRRESPIPKVHPLPPIVLDSAACPYCGVIQEPPPTRSKRCRDCKETIFTWTDQESRRRFLVTREDHTRIRQEEWDAEWKALNSQVVEGSRTGDWHEVKMAHFRQALMLFQKGRDHQQLAAESRKSELRYYRTSPSYQNLGVTQVTVSTAEEEACEQCRFLHGKVFEIDRALEAMPIPVRTCQTWADKNEHGGWCRCSYNPVIPGR